MSADAFDQLAQFIEDDLGFATSHYNDSYLDRRFSSRIRRTGCADYGEYLSLVREDDDEQTELLSSLSINVTGFFRNPKVWDEVADVYADLSDQHRRVKVWSAACADGREPYSMALLLHDDDRVTESNFSVTASDINEEALDIARNGVYESSRTNDIGENLEYLSSYEDYVDVAGDEYRITRPVKRTVSFESHDLINGRPKSGFQFVACRNMFIYIDNEYKIPVFETLMDSMVSGGYLVIGKAETIPTPLSDQFEAVNNRLRIYRYTP